MKFTIEEPARPIPTISDSPIIWKSSLTIQMSQALPIGVYTSAILNAVATNAAAAGVTRVTYQNATCEIYYRIVPDYLFCISLQKNMLFEELSGQTRIHITQQLLQSHASGITVEYCAADETCSAFSK